MAATAVATAAPTSTRRLSTRAAVRTGRPRSRRSRHRHTVRWKWTGQGGDHNVVHADGEFESELFREAGVHYERAFEGSGVYNYYCRPHQSLNIKGSVIVTE